MKTIIAGCRDFKDFDYLKTSCLNIFNKYPDNYIFEIVSGTANGADKLGELFASMYGFPVKQFKPDWSNGKIAGILRNRVMADYSDMLIAFWDGKSKGTKNMIEEASKRGLIVHVFTY